MIVGVVIDKQFGVMRMRTEWEASPVCDVVTVTSQSKNRGSIRAREPRKKAKLMMTHD